MFHFFFADVSGEGRLLFIVWSQLLLHFNKLLLENKVESHVYDFYISNCVENWYFETTVYYI